MMATRTFYDVDALDLDTLTADGDTLELDDRVKLVVKIEADPVTSIEDYDCYGTVADARENASGRADRPQGFDGAARKLWAGNYGPWWWQPPADMKGAAREDLDNLASHVAELLAYGFRCVGVVAVEEVESTIFAGMFSDVDIAQAWVCGVDSEDPAYIGDMVRDMAADVVGQLNDDAPSVTRTRGGDA